MTSKSFRALLRDAKLSQRELGRLLGKDPATVNRWCALDRGDTVEPPRYALAFIQAYALLRPIDRRSLAEALVPKE